MKCTNCNRELPKGATWCNMCGAPVVKKQQHAGLIIMASILGAIAIALVGFILIGNIRDRQNSSKRKASVNNKTDSNTDGNTLPEKDETVIAATSTKEKTIMIYMIGSNLESESGLATADIEEILDADYGNNVNIVIQSGGCTNWQNNIMKDNTVQRFYVENDDLTELKSMGRISMVDTNTLSDFITYTASAYPAEDYILLLWDHGGGVPIGFGYDELDPYNTLTEVELGEALQTANIKFESIIFDACNMCTLEIARAIEDYAEYMVAAESYVTGCGLYYTDFITGMDSQEANDPMDYCEIIVKGYMDSLREDQAVGSMSMIDLDRVDAVYNAYINYIDSVNTDVNSGMYAEYTKARRNCGLYEGTDSVDLITLATNYNTDMSSALINAVVNAVAYTDSDLLYGHGIAAYSPFNMVEDYMYARDSLSGLSYDERIIDFYDTYASIQLGYMGEDYINSYAGDWYNAEGVDSYVEEGTEAATYSVATSSKNGTDVIELSDDDLEILDSVTVSAILMMDDETGLLLGEDYYNNFDEDYDVIIDKPDYWVCVNDNIACYICMDIYKDDATDDWSQTGIVYAQRNGEDILLLLYYDQDYPTGTVLGYVPYDFETGEGNGGKYLPLNDDDSIDLVYPCISITTGETEYITLDEPFLASSLKLSYQEIELTDYKTVTYYSIYDIYGNIYKTEEFYFD